MDELSGSLIYLQPKLSANLEMIQDELTASLEKYSINGIIFKSYANSSLVDNLIRLVSTSFQIQPTWFDAQSTGGKIDVQFVSTLSPMQIPQSFSAKSSGIVLSVPKTKVEVSFNAEKIFSTKANYISE